jgi:phytoene dehydrogenase-like protein
MRLRGVQYPKEGLSYIMNALANEILKNDGKIHYNTSIKKILIENGQAVGISTKDNDHYFDVIVSNILVQELFRIVDEDKFPKEYLTKLKNLRGTASLCAYYAFNKIPAKFIGKNFIFVERGVGLSGEDVGGMVDFIIASPQSQMAPSQEYLVQAYAICTPEEARDKQVFKKLKDVLDKNLENIYTDYKEYLKWVIYPVIYHLDGVAKTLENEKPDIETPIENLFLVGDCVKAPGIGFNCALNSARILGDFLKNS